MHVNCKHKLHERIEICGCLRVLTQYQEGYQLLLIVVQGTYGFNRFDCLHILSLAEHYREFLTKDGPEQFEYLSDESLP